MPQDVKIHMVGKDLWVEDIEDLPCQVTDCNYVMAVRYDDEWADPELETGLLVVDGDKSAYIHADGGVEVFVRQLKEGEEPPEDA